MKGPLPAGIWVRILFGLSIVVLLRIAPRPYQADRHLEQALAARAAGDLDAVSDQLALAAAYLPGRSDLWEAAGQAALQAGDPQVAIYRLELAAARGSLSPAGTLALGDAFLALGDARRAIEIWQATLPDPAGYARLLEAYRRAEDYPAALAILHTQLQAEPDNARLLYEIGLLLAATRPEQAPDYLEQAAALDPRLAQAARDIASSLQAAGQIQEPAYTYLEAGRALAANREWTLAAEAFQRAVQARPDWAEAWAFRGEALQHLPGSSPHARQEAWRSLERAVTLDPGSLTTNLFLAMYWSRRGTPRLALESIRKASAADPQNPILQAEIASFLAEMGDLPAAQEYYERAIQLAPVDPTYWRFLADFSLQHGIQIRQIALPAARRAVILAPKDPASLDLLAHTLLLLGDYANAERFLHRALSSDSGYAPAYLHLGMNTFLKGDPPRARRQLEMAIALAPQTPAAEQAQRFLQRYLP